MQLTSAVEHYKRQQQLTARAVLGARRAWETRQQARMLVIVGLHQREAARDGANAVERMLAEQGITAPAVGRVNEAALSGVASDGRSLSGLLDQANSVDQLGLMVATQVQDAGRAGQMVATMARPKVAGHVRYLNPPSCGRCAVLAGRFYRYSDGFLRHPRCDCRMVPTNEGAADALLTDPAAAFRAGQVRGLSAADTKAIRAGADIANVVNVHRAGAGLTRAGRVIERGGRLTPEGILSLASDRAEAIKLLRQFSYLT